MISYEKTHYCMEKETRKKKRRRIKKLLLFYINFLNELLDRAETSSEMKSIINTLTKLETLFMDYQIGKRDTSKWGKDLTEEYVYQIINNFFIIN